MKDETVIQDKPERKKRSSLLSGRGILLAMSAPSLGESFVIDRDEMLIGRDPACDICLNDPLISKFHSRITFEEDRIFSIEDLGSTNGTYLNRKKLSRPEQLYYSDRIVMGTSIFRFFIEETIENSK